MTNLGESNKKRLVCLYKFVCLDCYDKIKRRCWDSFSFFCSAFVVTVVVLLEGFDWGTLKVELRDKECKV